MDGFFHHSRLLRCRVPQGAVPCGTDVTIAAEVGGSLAAADIVLRVWQDGAGEQRFPMPVENGRAEVLLPLPERPGLVWYYFILTLPDGRVCYYGAQSGPGRLMEQEPPSYRITVYDAAYETPAWFKEGVCYQIFPDRFRRSSWEDFHARLGAHAALGRRARVHERWSEAPLTTPPPGRDDYEPDDYFGGDLNGIREKLDYIASLGVTCLYLNPVFSAASNHRYNTADYLAIDPLLGTEADFALLCREARARGIRIMLDGVFSHTGSDSIYFNKEGSYGEHSGAYRDPDSPYRAWYSFLEYPEQYECWWGFPTLPNVRELTPSYIDFIAGENGVLAHWAGLGATSWRLDVADELPDQFIRILRKRVKAIDPEGVLLGEVWDEPSAKTGPEGRRGYVNGDELDSVMNYCFTDAVIAFLTGRTDAFAFADALAFLREQYPKPFYDAALNLVSSHDVVRAATALSGAPCAHPSAAGGLCPRAGGRGPRQAPAAARHGDPDRAAGRTLSLLRRRGRSDRHGRPLQPRRLPLGRRGHGAAGRHPQASDAAEEKRRPAQRPLPHGRALRGAFLHRALYGHERCPAPCQPQRDQAAGAAFAGRAAGGPGRGCAPAAFRRLYRPERNPLSRGGERFADAAAALCNTPDTR